MQPELIDVRPFTMGLLLETPLTVDNQSVRLGPSLVVCGIALSYNLAVANDRITNNLKVLIDDLTVSGYSKVVATSIMAQLQLFESDLRSSAFSVDPDHVKFLEPVLALAQLVDVH